MKKKELIQKDAQQLAEHIVELKSKLYTLQMTARQQGLKEVSQIRDMKREIARCKTLIAQA